MSAKILIFILLSYTSTLVLDDGVKTICFVMYDSLMISFYFSSVSSTPIKHNSLLGISTKCSPCKYSFFE